MLVQTEDVLRLNDLSVGVDVVVMPANAEPFNQWIDAFTGTVVGYDENTRKIKFAFKEGRVEDISLKCFGFEPNSFGHLAIISPDKIEKYRGGDIGDDAHDAVFPRPHKHVKPSHS